MAQATPHIVRLMRTLLFTCAATLTLSSSARAAEASPIQTLSSADRFLLSRVADLACERKHEGELCADAAIRLLSTRDALLARAAQPVALIRPTSGRAKVVLLFHTTKGTYSLDPARGTFRPFRTPRYLHVQPWPEQP